MHDLLLTKRYQLLMNVSVFIIIIIIIIIFTYLSHNTRQGTYQLPKP